MRREARNYVSPVIAQIEGYHGGNFKSLKVFNSDRVINLNDNYTVSDNNTASTLKLVKAGQHMNVFGIELETVSPIADISKNVLTNVLKMVFEKAGFPDDLFKVESDCTVSAECITQTFTKAWMRNNYRCFKAMYEAFGKLQITTNNEACGMHVNIDLANFGGTYEEQIENVRKLGYLINKHYDFFKIAFNRLGSTRWCPKMEDRKDYWKNTAIGYFPTDHSECCINMGHIRQSRVEIRLVGGQKNFPCFRNTMETVFHIIDRIKKLSWNDCDDLTKVFKGCNSYVFDRISTNCLRMETITASEIEKIRPTVKEVEYI